MIRVADEPASGHGLNSELGLCGGLTLVTHVFGGLLHVFVLAV